MEKPNRILSFVAFFLSVKVFLVSTCPWRGGRKWDNLILQLITVVSVNAVNPEEENLCANGSVSLQLCPLKPVSLRPPFLGLQFHRVVVPYRLFSKWISTATRQKATAGPFDSGSPALKHNTPVLRLNSELCWLSVSRWKQKPSHSRA